MGILIEQFKTDFNLTPTGSRGWYISKIRDTGLY